MYFRYISISRTLVLISIFALIVLLFQNGCKENVTVTEMKKPDINNPYNSINYTPWDTNVVALDSSGFAGLHQYIFSRKCSAPGCHDGNFEPDFRTIQSAYSTLVYHSVIKNNSDSSFDFRVKPFDKHNSWLYERITTTDGVLGKMPLYDTLSKEQIQRISDWITDGARDIFGKVPTPANTQPSSLGYVAFLPDSSSFRADQRRDDGQGSPFRIYNNTNVDMFFVFLDDSTAVGKFKYNKINYFKTLNTPDSTQQVDITFQTAPYFVYYDQEQEDTMKIHHKASFNSSAFEKDTKYYFRLYIQDEHHSLPTEIPENRSEYYIQDYFSFIIR